MQVKPHKKTANSRVLVIDDDSAVREALSENLKESGFEVLEAANGLHGLVMIEGYGQPDVIITDIIMPEMDGLTVIEEIQKIHPQAKIIAICGGGRTETEDFLELARKKGVCAAFAKPIDMDHLEALLSELIH